MMDIKTWNSVRLAERMRGHRVLSQFGSEGCRALAEHWEVGSAAVDDLVLDADTWDRQLCWLLEGELTLALDDGAATVALPADELIGAGTMAGRLEGRWSATAARPCVLALLPVARLSPWLRKLPGLQFHFPGLTPTADDEAAGSHPALGDVPGSDLHLSLVTRAVGSLVRRAPVLLAPETPIREAARKMSEQRISSVLIGQEDHLFGLITDRDLRSRVVAQGLDIERPVMDIATLAPMCIATSAPGLPRHAADGPPQHPPRAGDGRRQGGGHGHHQRPDRALQHLGGVPGTADIHSQESLEGLVGCAGKVRDCSAAWPLRVPAPTAPATS
jgi:CBS domain-containing protein